MKRFHNLGDAASFILSQYSGDLKVAGPLGLGKANQLMNLIYEHFEAQPHKKLEIYTALSLDVPQLKSDLEKKLLGPFLERHFKQDYPRLHYVRAVKEGTLPPNISLFEFYFLAGQYKEIAEAQQNYISLNYTHATRAIAARGLQVVIQLISPSRDKDGSGRTYSLSCNPDVTLDMYDLYRERGQKIFVVGIVHPDLPYLGGDAVVNEDFFDAIVESDEIRHELFAVPKNLVDTVDHLIGFHASQLMPDDGTLQIGIGSLSDALVYSLILRHERNAEYRTLVTNFWDRRHRPQGLEYHEDIFTKGIYGTSEMLMDGFMHLRKAQILKRLIFDHDENKKRYMHGAFFLGTKDLYSWLRGLEGDDYEGLSMTRVSKVNDLYDANELALRRQRKNARLFNTTMEINLFGAASSDTQPDGQVISGVGGQYNFVAMAHELPDARSVLMLRSTRMKAGRRYSNIVTSNGQTTIPRHLRDIVITEYGVADLHGKSDSEVAAALIQISDSEFQPQLIEWAKKQGKLPLDYELPESAQDNTPEKLEEFIGRSREKSLFPPFPFGSDFTPAESRLVQALSGIKDQPKSKLLAALLRGMRTAPEPYQAELEHLQLDDERISGVKERLMRWLILGLLN